VKRNKIFFYRGVLCLTVLTGWLSFDSYGQAQKLAGNTIIQLDPVVRTGKLPNGFTYYIRHNEEPKNRVIMYLVNKVGSVLEDEDQRGLAHFMEHMSFNGTKHFPKNELVDYLQRSGVRFGADLNAYTSFDETVYELPISSDKPELLKGGLQIMRDWAQEATLDPVEIDKERGVVLEEKRLGKGASERMQRQYFPLMLNHSRYASRIPIGLDTVLNNFTSSTLKRFYQDWYRPDLQALIIVGDVDVNKIEQSIRQQFATLKNPIHERLRTKYTVPLTGKNQFITVTDKEMTVTTAQVLIKHKAPELRTTGDYREAIIQNLFNQMLSARYAELGRRADAPYIQGSSGISGFISGLDSFGASITAKPGELEKGFKAVWRETVRLKQFGFTLTELQRAKTAYLNAMEASLKEKDKINSESYVKEYQANFLKGIAAPGITEEYNLIKADLPGITLAEVNNLSEEYIKATNRDILIMAPDKDKNTLPDEISVGNWLKAVEAESLQPYKDDISKQPLLSKEPVPGHITGELYDKKMNATTLMLSNGIKVILKPTDFKNNEIIFNAFAPGGTSLYNDADYQSANNAAGLISAGGAGNYGLDQLQKYLEGKQLKVGPYINERYQGINGASTTKDLETALQIIYAEFTEPRKDTAIFRRIIEKTKMGLINRAVDPGSVFSDTISAVLGNNNIRRTNPTLEKLNRIDLDKAYAIYKERFADAANFTFTFVGNIDIEAIKPLLEKYLGALPSTNNKEKSKDLNIHIPAGRIEKVVYKGTEPKSSVLLVYSGEFDYNMENKIKLGALKESLEIRLLQRLREDESGVYSPAVHLNISKYPQPRYSLLIQFDCAPQNVEKLITSTLDELEKLKTSGPPQENIDKWRAEEKNTMETQLKTNSFWLSYMDGQLQNEERLDQIDNYSKILNGITPADVKEIAGKYLNSKNYIKLVLMPEKSVSTGN
jgi:zinc protease